MSMLSPISIYFMSLTFVAPHAQHVSANKSALLTSCAEAVACKDVYDLFIKLIDPDPKTNAGSIVATPVPLIEMLYRLKTSAFLKCLTDLIRGSSAISSQS